MPCRCSVTIRFLTLFRHIHGLHYHPRVARHFLLLSSCPLLSLCLSINLSSEALKSVLVFATPGPSPWFVNRHLGHVTRLFRLPDPLPHHPRLGADPPATTFSSIRSRSGRRFLVGDDPIAIKTPSRSGAVLRTLLRTGVGCHPLCQLRWSAHSNDLKNNFDTSWRRNPA